MRELISSIDPHEIDNLISEVKVDTYKPKPFERLHGAELFDRQASRFVALGYPEVLGMTAPAFLRLVDRLRSKADGQEGNDIPFVVVIPSSMVSISDQLSLVEHDEGGVTQFLKDEDLIVRSGIAIPDEPYLAKGIDVGDQLRGVSPDAAVEHLIGEGRSPLTITEGAALLTHYPHILDFVNIHLAATVHQSGDAIDLYSYAGAVKLKRDPADRGDPRWGTPSCAERTNATDRPSTTL
ncbi:MAG TPA: DUF5701 family protein [Acidimicrobiia bacterium]|nr:DUF5701 family protein [Acidimicrobiia bacterium]